VRWKKYDASLPYITDTVTSDQIQYGTAILITYVRMAPYTARTLYACRYNINQKLTHFPRVSAFSNHFPMDVNEYKLLPSSYLL
jgi:hypothetical protein